ncbi:MAG TPA: hypothetical protein DCG19_00315 [Cryomorphaceae bacterium]|nr:hypothetical protein [Owenweeksia sp.]MBG00610.1 hypothetical protein [Owenweeksia sp.]HAD95811.1 hypothetical protein [Cryomorphaceae bacterium]HBF21606.1 hypothetical protein [Cryomorphaceae bacterium]HCQ15747.1 hypothetical protein [Cryomorphaceae bacterium]|tara:strand:- start:486 stop:665 length:180 start_codon:yes stop_codon:yes gene_type:complete
MKPLKLLKDVRSGSFLPFSPLYLQHYLSGTAYTTQPVRLLLSAKLNRFIKGSAENIPQE